MPQGVFGDHREALDGLRLIGLPQRNGKSGFPQRAGWLVLMMSGGDVKEA
jgi:hypothetical protein